jgi:N-acetylneuraminic acid mutarotase
MLAAIVAGPGGGGGEADAQARPGRWVKLPAGALRRTEVVAARVGRSIYAIGGFTPEPASTAAVERYDVERRRWRRVRPLPIAVNHAAATGHAGHVYVMGGYTARAGLEGQTARLYRYSPGRDRWARLPDAPVARGAHAMAAVGGKLYVVGGVEPRGVTTRLDVYDIARRRWSRGPDMEVAREHLGAAALGRSVYVLAGRTAAGNLTAAERFDTRSRAWERLPEMDRDRGGNSAAAAGGRVVVFGGEEGAGTIREVEAFDPRTRRWTRLADMPTPRHGLGAVGLGNSVFAVQGGPQPGFAFSAALEELRLPPR